MFLQGAQQGRRSALGGEPDAEIGRKGAFYKGLYSITGIIGFISKKGQILSNRETESYGSNLAQS